MDDMKFIDTLEEVLLERGFPLDIMQSVLETVQTSDAVEVVRCKDCKRCFSKRTVRKKQLMRFCMRMDGNEFQVNANDFCSYGERRNNAAD